MYDYNYCPVCGEKLKEHKVDGHLRSHCTNCSFVHYQNPKPAAGAIAVNGDNILLIKRGVEPGKGIWAPPSGFIDPGETAEEACLRELKEETGLEGNIKELIGVYTQKADIYGPIMIIMFLIKNLKGDMKAADDAEDVKFVKINQVDDLGFTAFNTAFKQAKKMI